MNSAQRLIPGGKLTGVSFQALDIAYHKPVDPRAPRLLGLVDEAAAAGEVSGAYAQIGRAIEAHPGY